MEAHVIEHEGKNVIEITPTPKIGIKKGLILVPMDGSENVSTNIMKAKRIYEFPDSRIYKEILILKKTKK